MLAGAKHTVLLFSDETITSEVFLNIFKLVLSYYISQTIFLEQETTCAPTWRLPRIFWGHHPLTGN